MRILIAEDEKELLELLRISLGSEFVVDAVGDIESAKAFVDGFSYGVALYDRGFSGVDMAKELISYTKNKQPQCAVLLLSAMSTVDDKVEGLEFGADDYLEKPFDIKELKARIYALSRRFSGSKIQLGDIEIDMDKKTVAKDGAPVAMSRNEHSLLFYLLSRKQEVVSREEIMDAIYERPSDVTQNAVDELVARVRKKLGFAVMKTVKTRGYTIEI